MAEVHTLPEIAPQAALNVTDRLAAVAASRPDAIAVACHGRMSPSNPQQRVGKSGSRYATVTFAALNEDVERIARGLLAWGVPPGTRLALLVRPGIEFVSLVFALLRAGMVIVLVDPGMGRRNLIRCLEEAEPEGFVAISAVQAVRLLMWHKFPRVQWNVTVGRRWFWGGMTLELIRKLGAKQPVAKKFTGNSSEEALAEPVAPKQRTLTTSQADDPAAIIFTSGSTGIPKGVLYTQRMFDTQVAEIQSQYGIEAGGIDLACFPLFALFNSAMGVTTVLPEMDFSRPATARPQKLLAAANDWSVAQAFASPAVWRLVGEHCERTGERIPTLRQVFSCGAPVPANVIRATLACVAQGAQMHTPYGATECLPVATIEAGEILGETAARTDQGAGICVGRKFDSIEWQVIRITDEPIAAMDDAEELPFNEVGELVVRGPQVSRQYITSPAANAVAKIADGEGFWHRTGDVGYLDASGRFWYCGRKSQRVETSAGTMYTEVYEGMFNKHPAVRRSALVGVGPRGNQQPVMILECTSPVSDEEVTAMKRETEGGLAVPDGEILVVDWALPVDVRHNAKINREQLAIWAAKHVKPKSADSVSLTSEP